MRYANERVRRLAAPLCSLSITPVVLAIVLACDPGTVPPTGPRIRTQVGLRTTVIGANVVVIPTLGAGPPSAADINDAGQVVGYAFTPQGRAHAFLWTSSQGIQDLGTLGGDDSFAEAVNDAGQVVGASMIAGTFVQHAFLWTPGHGMQDLGTLGGTRSGARGINDRGQVVGHADTPNGSTHAFLWTPGQGMQDLGTLGGAASDAKAINDVGQVTGTSGTAAGGEDVHAFLWTAAEGMGDLGSLGGDPTVAMAVNVAGWVVGRTLTIPARAFLWLPSDGIRDLGRRGPVGRDAVASDVNDAGQVVGWSAGAFLWTLAGGMEDISQLTGIEQPLAINNRGQVAGGDRVATLEFQVPNRAPVASVGGPYTGAKKKPLAFDGTRSTDPDGDLLTYAWDFGDGSPSVGGAAATHEYDTWGTYVVTLRVTDPGGLSATETTSATIAPPGHLKTRP